MARTISGEVIDVSPAHHSYVVRQPLGVVAAIVPWNVPIVLTISKAAPALAAGNSVVVKPSQTTPLTALYLAKLWEELDLPAGVFNVINGPGSSVGESLCLHPLVTGITFTGGTSTGLHLGELAARQNKRVMLELGGKSPNIVLSDADLSRAIPGSANAIFYGQGQICAAGSRLLVEAPVYDELVDGVSAFADAMKIGDPFDESTEFGCVTSLAHRDDLLGWVERAASEGATVKTGGNSAIVPGLPNGAFIKPTVLVDVTPTAPISCEEVFGPILVIQKISDIEEAISLANDSQFGLSAGVWSRDSAQARSVARRLHSGVVWINDYGVFNPAMPFGGVKLSGSSHREWGHLALDAYLEHKSIWEANA
jgi:acyl-CoA reductase-like NAD-dependent aldehyde dehydrogenase